MTQQIINVGSAPNDSTGDPIRTAWIKANGNFTELYGAPVRVDIPQSLTDTQQTQARSNIFAAPFDALAYNGMQINGSMEVSQERGGSGINPTGYVSDVWRFSQNSSSLVTASQSGQIVTGFTNCLQIIVNTPQASLTAAQYVDFEQGVEGYRIARLAWGTANAQPLTIGFWTDHHRTGTYSVAVQNFDGSRSYVATYTQNAADIAQYNVITIPGDTAGTWKVDNSVGMYVSFVVACGSTFTAPSSNNWLAGSYKAGPGQVNAVAATTDVFRITGVVVIPGIEAPSAARSSLIMRPFDQELLACQRYYQKYSGYLTNGYNTAAGTSYGLLSLSPTMRSAPAVNFANIAYGNASALTAALIGNNLLRTTITVTATGLGYAQSDIMLDARL